MNPGHPLPARAQRTAGEETEGERHLGERAAVLREDDPGAQQRPAHAEGLDFRRRFFPIDADLGKEIAPRRVLLAHDLVAAGAVIADRRALEEDPRLDLRLADGRGDRRARTHPAVDDPPLALLAPASVGDPLAGQVDDGGVRSLGQIRPAVGAHPVPTHGTDVRRQILYPGRVPAQHDDVLSRLSQFASQGRADQAAPSSDQHPHGENRLSPLVGDKTPNQISAPFRSEDRRLAARSARRRRPAGRNGDVRRPPAPLRASGVGGDRRRAPRRRSAARGCRARRCGRVPGPGSSRRP